MRTLASLSVVAFAGAASAMPVVDGSITGGEYGPALWVQDTGTGFGNNTDASVELAGGDEINAAYASIDGGILTIGLTGNFATNFNKTNIAIDFIAGGQQTFSGLAGGLGNINGLTLDAGFEADALLSYTAGNATPDSFVDAWLADGSVNGFIGGGSGASTMLAYGASTVDFSVDNSNILGVGNLGDPFDSAPDSVTTGLEVAIDLAALGYTGGEIKVGAWINGGNNDFLSNQVVGGLPTGSGNLGGDGAGNFTGNVGGVDFSAIAGDQFVVIPTPGAVSLLGLAGLAAARRRR